MHASLQGRALLYADGVHRARGAFLSPPRKRHTRILSLMRNVGNVLPSRIIYWELETRMPFIKLDTRILDSSLWVRPIDRDLFITALLKCEPRELLQPEAQLEIRTLDTTGWCVPAGWYGFVRAAAPGLAHAAVVPEEAAIEAFERLGSPEQSSASPEYDGRRLIRVSGGFIVLNYMKYRDFDYGSRDRQRRLRERAKAQREVAREASRVTTVTSRRDVTQADADADADAEKYNSKSKNLPAQPIKPARRRREPDPRHMLFKAKIGEYWRLYNPGHPDMPWDGAEGKALDALLKSSPSLDIDAFRGLVRSRGLSEVNHGERPSIWLRTALRYLSGPLNRYSKPLRMDAIPQPGIRHDPIEPTRDWEADLLDFHAQRSVRPTADREAWRRCLVWLQSKINIQSIDTWLKPLRLLPALNGGKSILVAPSEEWGMVQGKYGSLICEALYLHGVGIGEFELWCWDEKAKQDPWKRLGSSVN